ncbi:AraC family transcriptional regulator [Paenibacillus sp. SYP-B3998]|uniref:AraC family transcriptional regulator n=1 Tax=Paenibacillus sp. SYP-B3998 TaxID=2678564 RepID=A0A6G3ZTZ5_9BACL|nr:helix-turn-helix domain-containing protein [Paenibacillus sp. SYP-B3998]NEW05686.1 AraC family transcriptional regulator [Paenibacillus sp. SYP-B3998]
MQLRTYIPQTPLSDFVDFFWYFEGYSPSYSKELALPDGSIELVINLREDENKFVERESKSQIITYGSSVICGPHSEFFIIDTSSEATVLGIHFKPGGIYPFLNIPVSELHNIHVSLDVLWGVRAHDLREALLFSKTIEEKFQILEGNLIELASRPLIRHPAVSFALNEFLILPHKRPLTEVIEQIGLSQRRFIQIFKEEVGMTPKLFCRLRRFKEVLNRIEDASSVDWSDVAIACGYYDQMHFIKDFQAFSSLNPTDYFARQRRHHNHVALYN